MPLSGGSSDKFGNRYEGRWTVLQIIRILREQASSICLEPISEDGCEFIVISAEGKEYHQVKRQYSKDGRWTLKMLESKGILGYFKSKLADPKAICYFVSTNSAYQVEELSTRARNAGSFARFDTEFLSTENWRTDFEQICEIWAMVGDEEAAFNLLQRIRIKTVDEETLLDMVTNAIEPVIVGNARSTCDIIAQFALDNVNRVVNSVGIWHYLTTTHGLKKHAWAQDHLVFSAVEKLVDQFASPLVREMISQNQIPSGAYSDIINSIKQPKLMKQGVLAVGEAGIGKSCAVLEVTNALLEEKWLVLPIRVTTLDPVRDPAELGQSLGLPGSPAQVLSELSMGKPCLLVIDQLDALSLISGRSPSFFDCFHALIRQAAQFENMRILVACRKFDLENDYRFRRFSGPTGILEEVQIIKLEKQIVLDVVGKLGLVSSRLSARQLELLSLPLHLKLFTQISADTGRDPLSFGSAGELFEHFWDFKRNALRERRGSSDGWVSIVDTMCDYMNDRQQLSVPNRHLDPWQDDYLAMVSEHVLTKMGNRVSFFHESFFDYCFARRFFARNQNLVHFLKEDEQHIFKRAQCRQILIQQRTVDFDDYCVGVRHLLGDESIRFHLKEVISSILGNLGDPTDAELDIVLDILRSGTSPISDYLFRVISRSAVWFDHFQSRQLIRAWLGSEDEVLCNRATDFCRNVSRDRPRNVADLFSGRVGQSEDWNRRLHHILYFGDISQSRELFNLLLQCIDCGLFDFDKQMSKSLDHILYPLRQKNPEWACEAVGKYFTRYYDSQRKNKGEEYLQEWDAFPRGQFDDLLLKEIAKNSPREFAQNLLPLIVKVVRENSNPDDEMPFMDSVFCYRPFGGSYSTSSTLLSAMETALMKIAVEDAGFARTLIADLDLVDADTIQFLITRVFTGNGKEFADEAVEYLCGRPSRLHSGYMCDTYWATRCLIESISPYCSDYAYSRLEHHILNYYPRWEKSKDGYKSYGSAQFELLNGLPVGRMSQKAKSRLAEWRRKFLRDDVDPPEPMEVKAIGSPVPQKAREKLSDEQWMKAIAKYSRGRRETEVFELKGGAHELSGLLELATKENPVRFAKLGIKLPDETNPRYFEAILRGLEEKAQKIEDVIEFCYRCHDLPGRPCGRCIHNLIAKFSKEEVPTQALELVAWYATQDPDPDKELWRMKASSGAFYYNGDIMMAAINSVRGSACESLSSLIFDNRDRIHIVRKQIEIAIKDSSPCVRSTAGSLVLSILKHYPVQAVEYFLRICDTDDAVLGTHFIERFLYYATRNHYDKLKPILVRMLNSAIPSVVRVGSRQMCLAAFNHPDAVQYADNCLKGGVDAQFGLAQVCASNIDKSEFFWFCSPRLEELFRSQHKEVRDEAGNCFRQFTGESIGEQTRLIDAYVGSPAFQEDPYALMHALEESTAKMPESILGIAEQVIQNLSGDSATIMANRITITDSVCRLLMRVYCQTTDPAIHKRCLDCFDAFLQFGVYGINEVIALQDR